MCLTVCGTARAAETTSASDALLAEARRARANGDTETVRWALLAWASLTRPSAPPSEFADAVPDLVLVAAEAGPFRLFGSRLADRVRLGLHDPFRLVGRLVVTARNAEMTRLLRPLEGATGGRLEYGMAGEPIPDRADVTIVAFMTRLGKDIAIRSVELPAKEGMLPPIPPLLTSSKAASAPSPTVMDPVVPWWIYVAALLAVGFGGAGIWQEMRR